MFVQDFHVHPEVYLKDEGTGEVENTWGAGSAVIPIEAIAFIMPSIIYEPSTDQDEHDHKPSVWIPFYEVSCNHSRWSWHQLPNKMVLTGLERKAVYYD